MRNASLARHPSVMVPLSKMKQSLCQILRDEGFIREFQVIKQDPVSMMKIYLIYDEKNDPAIRGLQRVSKPSLRIYSRHNEVPRVLGGLGTTIMSTSKGVMTGTQAWRQRVGGEVLCVVW